MSAIPESQVRPMAGYWAAECCILDLFQIKTQEEADDLWEVIQERWAVDGFGLSVWPTLEAAYASLGNDDVLPPDEEKSQWEALGMKF